MISGVWPHEPFRSRIGRLAREAGVSVPEYLQRRRDGERHCHRCRHWVTVGQYDEGASACRTCVKGAAQDRRARAR